MIRVRTIRENDDQLEAAGAAMVVEMRGNLARAQNKPTAAERAFNGRKVAAGCAIMLESRVVKNNPVMLQTLIDLEEIATDARELI
jgi:hypothetical protein